MGMFRTQFMQNLSFRPKARLLLQLGDELIRNESVALLELVKNAYDADATNVSLTMNDVDSIDDGVIIVEDDGSGMDMQTITNVWMEPGSDYKADLSKTTKKFGRTVLGEKGVGRFAVHKMGDIVDLTTRQAGKKEIHLTIDWNMFQSTKYLEDVPVQIEEREPVEFVGDMTGTKIIIRSLRSRWTRAMLREVYRSYSSLRSPYDSPDAFKTKFTTNKKNWLKGMASWHDIQNLALFRFACEIQGNRIEKFEYEFMPWSAMNKLTRRKVTENGEFGKNLEMKDARNNSIDMANHQIGRIRFAGHIFDLDSKILKLGLQDRLAVGEQRGVREYLSQNGGIRVFRDGMRVYDYGEPENDWLNLDMRRVNVPTRRISNNIIVASVSLDRKTSLDLREKTNREGFIVNDAYQTFVQAVLYAVGVIEAQRAIDKEKIRKYYGPTPKSESVLDNIARAKNIAQKITDKKLQKDIVVCLDHIERDYKAIHSTLLRSAGAGLNLSVAVHEMEKVTRELVRGLETGQQSDRMLKLADHLAKLVEGYSTAIQKSTKRSWSAHDLINHALFNFDFRFQAHNVCVVFEDQDAAKNVKIKCSRSYIVSSMMNILDNSLWWLEYGNSTSKKIFVTVRQNLGETIILFADNGNGFSLPTDMLTEPGVTAKPDGMGLGLHIANEVMVAHKGRLSFPEPHDYDIPEEFRKGAVVALIFGDGGK